MKYFSNPPQPKIETPVNVPSFIAKHYKASVLDTAYVVNLFNWAQKEYFDTVAWSISSGNKRVYDMLQGLSGYHILAMSDEFERLLKLMDKNLWNSFPARVRKRFREVYAIYMNVRVRSITVNAPSS